ncbi:hypothetical protein V9K67_01165 [Paraflavisolibacter sp. H34]|uniref:hypothetical protein n=1 Tax=Huijunlia imazamoxiresistens TaxID=3127457 RepID=UPI00301B1692
MSKDQIKYEINQVLEHIPDKALDELLAYLKELEGKYGQSGVNTAHLDKIFGEDQELLKKLAQ